MRKYEIGLKHWPHHDKTNSGEGKSQENNFRWKMNVGLAQSSASAESWLMSVHFFHLMLITVPKCSTKQLTVSTTAVKKHFWIPVPIIHTHQSIFNSNVKKVIRLVWSGEQRRAFDPSAGCCTVSTDLALDFLKKTTLLFWFNDTMG